MPALKDFLVGYIYHSNVMPKKTLIKTQVTVNKAMTKVNCLNLFITV